MSSAPQETAPKIPASTGIPPIVIVAFVFGLLVIFAILALVGATANTGHVWPAIDSMKAPLTPMK